jgi:hypothetical protein
LVQSQDLLPNLKTGRILDSKMDAEKRIWIATDHGLVLHDGSNYIKIKPTQKQYIGQSINALHLYKDYLYVIFTKSGVVRFDINNFSSTEISNLPVESIVQFNDQHYYILFNDGRIVDRFSNNQKQLCKLAVNIESHSIMSKGPNNTLLVSIPKIGLYQINALNGNLIKDFKIAPTGFLNSFATLKNRYFFINKWEVLELDSTGNFSTSKYLKAKENYQITNLYPISDTSMIIVRFAKNTYYFEKDSVTFFDINRVKNYEVKNVLFFNENNIYIGTNQGMLKAVNTEKKVSPLYDTTIKTQDYVRVRRKILPLGKDQFIAFGTPNSYLYTPKNNSFTKISNSEATLYDAIVVGNNVYASSEGGGVKKIDLNTKKLTTLNFKNFDSTRMYMAILDIHSKIKNSALFGTRGRIVLYNYVTNQVDTISLKNINARVRALEMDSAQNKVYVGTEDGLYTVDLNTRKLVGRIQMKGNFITDLKFSKYLDKQLLWAASDYGVEAYDKVSGNVAISIPIEKFNNAKIAAILVDKFQNIWISTFVGVYAYNPVNKSLLKLVNEKQLVNLEYNFKSAAVLQNGNLIFGGLNGYDIFDPNLFDYEQKHNQGIITGYSTYSPNDTSFSAFVPNKPIVYNSDNNFLQIFFSINNSEKLEYCTFEYQVDNLNWIPVRSATNIILFKLLDGNHTVQIRGTDDLGRTILFEPIQIEYRTPFIKTAYFNYVLLFFIFFLVILFGWSIYKKVNDENRLKEQIAMDLHDEIGTLLTKALYKVKHTDSGEKSGVGGAVFNYISEALFSIRTYINAINIEFCSLHQLIDEIREFKHSFLGHNDIEYELTYDFDKDYEISSSQYRDLKLMCYEINQNVVKHSKATYMNTQIIAKDHYLTIKIEDNGELYDPMSIESKGNGIGNLKKRAKRLGGKINFSSPENGSGLCILIEAKL